MTDKQYVETLVEAERKAQEEGQMTRDELQKHLGLLISTWPEHKSGYDLAGLLLQNIESDFSIVDVEKAIKSISNDDEYALEKAFVRQTIEAGSLTNETNK